MSCEEFKRACMNQISIYLIRKIISSTATTMALRIIWNRLYINRPQERAFARRRIEFHYFKKKMGRRGFRIANVR